MNENPTEIARAIMDLVIARGHGKTICPSEAARRLDPENWRGQLKTVRRTAVDLANSGRIAIYRKGKPIDPAEMKGVIRLGLPPEG